LQVPTPLLSEYEVRPAESTNPGLSLSQNLAQGDTQQILTKWNQNALALDLSHIYGGGGCSIYWGLDMQAVGGLTLLVNEGVGVSYGLVQAASSTVVLPSSSTCFIFLQNGALTYTTSTTPPSGNTPLYLGCAVTTSGISSLDQSGVIYNRNGSLWRETADTAAPQDSPPAGMSLYTKTLGGNFFWNGSEWSQLLDSSISISSSGVTLNKHLYLTSSSSASSVTLTSSSVNVLRINSLTRTTTAVVTVSGGAWFKIYNDGDQPVSLTQAGTSFATISPFSEIELQAKGGIFYKVNSSLQKTGANPLDHLIDNKPSHMAGVGAMSIGQDGFWYRQESVPQGAYHDLSRSGQGFPIIVWSHENWITSNLTTLASTNSPTTSGEIGNVSNVSDYWTVFHLKRPMRVYGLIIPFNSVTSSLGLITMKATIYRTHLTTNQGQPWKPISGIIYSCSGFNPTPEPTLISHTGSAMDVLPPGKYFIRHAWAGVSEASILTRVYQDFSNTGTRNHFRADRYRFGQGAFSSLNWSEEMGTSTFGSATTTTSGALGRINFGIYGEELS